ncbi:MAG: tRNA (adenosine(37)-N6)-threonylcarbamoyltransferase complex ATPase subunit type 1 TsaE [Candidatus Sedimenticola endophacoides]|uniref:tRNA threonylcarbamoyladenosine biosynthesis protein TsaE n=1 Tax=Candidatus Sedimenticola endophacoides TaxID=2548426 RepID=A0A6N4E3J0_9GAMM|nr:MAG: tRNA (adenosine(37)-N6)-threonylcarbamoyltransferase complex ATPase subunit type 1 TsaE [Candidatus Sedimenticola endophacoides]OQX32876.1 MAG: tRNA (adenosine(37)-N6)-threonylcarbamoyltransferase complex ATPase subunit type 1 TsaE [Candidatus Sedimenticola endophacoides]OQX41497.1 MAG: tRNA (adenosine(37)-N6)-threonylcarbamoyltransferase complex ATPase subunit type 1 TsaE [Candidatus Sedimenticola endophacoides]OQX42633.1 MAG: tRNA (adenosine(37)-N6)-threonylcarbamoyltransferase complex
MLRLEAGGEVAQEALGGRIAAACPRACVIYLEGELGAGKTTLVRGFLRALGHRGSVRSPTYTLLEPYELATRNCYHLDLYRLADPSELEYLGVADLLASEAVLLVEWPDRGQGWLPSPDLLIRIEYQPEGRVVELIPESAVGGALIEEI